jgi:aspartokinase
MHTKLQVMKFGGTSVGDAACIRRSTQIVANASREYSVAVVVSAMSGVTNRLIDAAHQAKRGDREAGKTLGDAFASSTSALRRWFQMNMPGFAWYAASKSYWRRERRCSKARRCFAN